MTVIPCLWWFVVVFSPLKCWKRSGIAHVWSYFPFYFFLKCFSLVPDAIKAPLGGKNRCWPPGIFNRKGKFCNSDQTCFVIMAGIPHSDGESDSLGGTLSGGRIFMVHNALGNGEGKRAENHRTHRTLIAWCLIGFGVSGYQRFLTSPLTLVITF